MWQLLVLVCCAAALLLAYSLAMRLLRTISQFIDELITRLVAIFFFLLIVPLVWLWEKGRRPMWRTLTKEQTRDLESWLRRAATGRK